MLSKNIEQNFEFYFKHLLNSPSLLVQNRVTVNLIKRYKEDMKTFTLEAHRRATCSCRNLILSSFKPCVKCVKVFLEEESHLNYFSEITNNVFFMCRNTDNFPPNVCSKLLYFRSLSIILRISLQPVAAFCILTVLFYCPVISLM